MPDIGLLQSASPKLRAVPIGEPPPQPLVRAAAKHAAAGAPWYVASATVEDVAPDDSVAPVAAAETPAIAAHFTAPVEQGIAFPAPRPPPPASAVSQAAAGARPL